LMAQDKVHPANGRFRLDPASAVAYQQQAE
jgi:hypothetical protein